MPSTVVRRADKYGLHSGDLEHNSTKGMSVFIPGPNLARTGKTMGMRTGIQEAANSQDFQVDSRSKPKTPAKGKTRQRAQIPYCSTEYLSCLVSCERPPGGRVLSVRGYGNTCWARGPGQAGTRRGSEVSVVGQRAGEGARPPHPRAAGGPEA